MNLTKSRLKEIIKNELTKLLQEQSELDDLTSWSKSNKDKKEPKTCTYSTYAWHVARKRAVDHRRISKPYSEVTDIERDPNEPRCSTCFEDQVEVKVPGAPPVTVCWVYADRVEQALKKIVDSGTFQIKDLTGYRVGKTRGAIQHGQRSAMSNHSFGTAIDINRNSNGLYRGRKRRMGGHWDPKRNPDTTIVPNGIVYQEFSQFWKWGGELKGSLKDYMHFSITGK